ncbi:MAG: hypothetical protein ACR2KQ_11640 [Actinomycetota bacterium]
MLERAMNKKMLAAWALVLGIAGAGVACDNDPNPDDVIIEGEQEGADLDPDIEDTPGDATE